MNVIRESLGPDFRWLPRRLKVTYVFEVGQPQQANTIFEAETADGRADPEDELISSATSGNSEAHGDMKQVQWSYRFERSRATSDHPTPLFDRVTIDFQDTCELGIDQVRNIVSAIRAAFRPQERGRNVVDFLGLESRGHFVARDEALRQMEGAIHRLVDAAAKTTTEITERYAEIDERRRKNDEERQRRFEAECKSKREAVDAECDARLAAVEAREKKLDTEEPRSRRRKVLDALKAQIAESHTKFDLSGTSKNKRWWVFSGCAVFLLLLGDVWYQQGLQLSEALTVPAAEMDWARTSWFFVRQLFTSSLMAAVAVFYIRWSSRWAEQHAAEEMRLKRLAIELERAGWIVETVLAWEDQEAKDKRMPDKLLEGLVRNLFVDPGIGKAVEMPMVTHPLMGSGSDNADAGDDQSSKDKRKRNH